MRNVKKVLLSILLGLLFIQPVFVYADSDKTTLVSLRDETQTAINNQLNYLYQTDSYDYFYTELTALGGLAAVDAMIADTNALQTDVDQMASDLQTVLSYLTYSTTYTAVSGNLATAKTLDVSAYTARSILDYNNELDRIDAELAHPEYGETYINSLNTDITNASNLLILLGDKTELTSTYQEAESIYLDGSAYIPSTYTSFQTAYDAINTTLFASIGLTKEEVVSSNDSSVDEISQTLTEINQSLTLLVLKPDKTELETAYQTALAIDETLYTPNSYQLFISDLVIINAIINDDEATETDVANGMTTLNGYYSILVLRADKTVLENLNNEAIIAYYEERGNYTESSYNLFKTAVIEYGTYIHVNEVINDLNVLQSSVDDLSLQIQTALSMLVELQDNTALLVDYELKLTLDTTNDTPASITLYQAELDRIYQIITGKELSLDTYNQAATDLENVTSILIAKADKSELTSLYNNAMTLREEDYSVSSFTYLQEIFTETNTILLDDNASQTSVDDEVVILNNALSMLQTTLSEVIISEQESINILSYVTLGNATIVQISASDESIISVTQNGDVLGITYGHANVLVSLSNGVVEQIPILVKATVPVSTILFVSIIPLVSTAASLFFLFYKKSKFSFLKKRFK